MKWFLIATAIIWNIVTITSIMALQISTRGSSHTVVEHRSDLLLRCHAMFFNSEDELTRITWYHLAPPPAAPEEIFTLDATREHPSYFFSAKWAGRGIFQPIGETAARVTIVLPARFVTRKVGGRYRCQMNSMMSSGFADATIAVQFGPGTSLTLSPSGRVQRDEGEELTFACSAECNPYCDYRWYRAGRVISSTSALHIPFLSRDDTGLYACQARNNAGSSVKPVDLRVRFAAVVTALSMIALQKNSTDKLKENRNLQHGFNNTDEVPQIIAAKELRSSLRQFTVTLVCNVTGWPEPIVKWQAHRDLYRDSNSSETNIPTTRFASMVHRWSFTEKSYVGVIANATCLDNGKYSCLTYNNYNKNRSSLETFPEVFSKQTALLDLPCPPVHILEPSSLKSLFVENTMAPIQRNTGFKESDKERSYKDLCRSSTGFLEMDGDIRVIVAEFNTTISIRACFIGNPKPTVQLRRLSSNKDSSITLSEISRKQSPLTNRNQRTPEKKTLRLPQSDSNARVSDSLLNTVKITEVGNISRSSRDRKNDFVHLKEPNQEEHKDKDKMKNRKVEYSEEQIGTTLYHINDVKEEAVYCSNSTDTGLCVVQTNLTLTTSDQYGYYELVAKNSYGETKRKYRIVYREAPHPPTSLRLINVSSASACFSWNGGFDGGTIQTFHLCNNESLGPTDNNRIPRSIEDNIDPENNCVAVKSRNGHESRIGRDNNYSSDSGTTYSHCVINLTSGEAYKASIFSSNHYGNSKTSAAIYFRTKLKTIWVTSKPILSYLPSTTPAFSFTEQIPLLPPAETTDQGTQLETTSRSTQFDIQAEKSEPRQPNRPTNLMDAVDDSFESENKRSHQGNLSLNQLDEDTNLERDILKDTNEEYNTDEQEPVDDILQELLFDEDDFIYGKINDIQFFQLFDAYHLMESEYDDDDFEETSTKTSLPFLNKKTLDKRQVNQKRQKLPPIHLQKLLLRYSRPHTKLRKTRTEVKSQNISLILFTSPRTSVANLGIEKTTTSHVLLDKEFTLSPGFKQYTLVAIIGAATTVLIVLAGVFIYSRLQVWRRRRRIKQLKQSYHRRMKEQAIARRHFPSVQIEDANTARNRLSSLRNDNAPLPLNLRAFPMLLPRPETSQTAPFPTCGSQRQSTMAVSNETTVNPPPFSNLQAPLQRLQIERNGLPQRQLRPTSSTPATGNGINKLSASKAQRNDMSSLSTLSTPTASKTHLNVPTITIAEDCGFSNKHPPISVFPSYLDLQTDDNMFSFDCSPNRNGQDHLRPPSHHSSYASVHQGSPLLRLDSSSSGTTANYFNLYEGLTTNSQRSRSPSNIYDPLTFEASARSNPPSRRGSHVGKETRQGEIDLDANDIATSNHVAVESNHDAAFIAIPTPETELVAVEPNHTKDPRYHCKYEADCATASDWNGRTRNFGGLEIANTSDQNTPPNFGELSITSNYERIVRQSPTFSRDNHLRVGHAGPSFSLGKPRKSLALKQLFSLSLPRNVERNSGTKDTRKSLNVFELNDSEKKVNTLPFPQIYWKHGAGKKTPEKGVKTKPVSRVPLPPVPTIERCNMLEESIYTDIDDSLDKAISTNSNCDGNKSSIGNNKLNDNNNGTNNKRFQRVGNSLQNFIHTPMRCRSQSPNKNTSEAFVSIDSILCERKSSTLKSNKPPRSRIPTDCQPDGQQRLPDIMLCADHGSASNGQGEEEAYSTIDFPTGCCK